MTNDRSDQRNYAGGFWSLVPYDGGRGTPWDPSPPSHWSFQEQVQKAFEQSALFRDVVLGENATDLSAHMEIKTGFEYGGAMGITTSGILFLLGWPAVFDVTEITVTTTFQGGERTGTLERRTAVKRRGHLLMPLLYPLRGHPERAVRDAFFDLVSATILEADHEGFFD